MNTSMDTIIVAAQKRIMASWWDELSPESKKEYIEEHPESKYAKEALGESKPAAKPNPKPNPAAKPGHTTPPPAGHGHPKAKMSEGVQHAVAALPEHDQHFYAEGGQHADSHQRRKAAQAIKDKSKGILAHLKGQKEEWKAGFGAIKKLKNRQPLSDHDKDALKACAQDIVITLAGVAITGGLAHGVAAAVAHLGQHFFTDVVLKAAGHALVRASVVTADDEDGDDKLALSIINQLADMFQNQEIPDDVLAKYIAKTNKQ